MNEILIGGIDPGFRNFGMVKGFLDLDTLKPRITQVKLIETEPDKSKQVRKGNDDLRRCREIMVSMTDFFDDILFGFSEIPIGGAKSANALKGLSFATAILGACPAELVEVSPAEVKMATCGKKTAAKEDMIEWAIERHPEVEWLTYRGQFVAKNEHIADGICAIYAGLQTQQFKQTLAILRASQRMAA